MCKSYRISDWTARQEWTRPARVPGRPLPPSKAATLVRVPFLASLLWRRAFHKVPTRRPCSLVARPELLHRPAAVGLAACRMIISRYIQFGHGRSVVANHGTTRDMVLLTAQQPRASFESESELQGGSAPAKGMPVLSACERA
eukprot:362143-Chlamydomonas_euryale.AAC.4